MRIFISWSRPRAKQVAAALVEWIPTVNHLIQPWASPEIKPGSRWRDELSRRLRDINVGIICVTPEALYSPWLNFEAGALAQSVEQGILCPYLFGLDPDKDDDNPLRSSPLADFQYVKADRDGTLRLLQAINSALPSKLAKPDDALLSDFDDKWPRLKKLLGKVHGQPEEEARDHARQVLEGINRGAGPLPSEVGRSLWIPALFQQVRSRLDGIGSSKKTPTLDIFDINALAPLHSGFEMFLELLRRGGRVRIMMLDPRSKDFAARSKLEHDEVGRIAAEEVASFHIIGDLIAHMRRARRTCKLEVRLTSTLPKSAMVLVEVDKPNGLVLANPYPSDPDTRGLAFPWYTYSRVDGALYSQYRDDFEALWERAAKVAPRSTVGRATVWPFTEGA